jgi:hypothetical protein
MNNMKERLLLFVILWGTSTAVLSLLHVLLFLLFGQIERYGVLFSWGVALATAAAAALRGEK